MATKTHSVSSFKKMVTMWSTFLILPSLFVVIKAVSLLDFPMEAPNDHLIFHSVLTDVATSQQWHITESLAGVSQVHGKIQVTMADTHQFEIFYHEDRDDHRLLLNDDSCSLITYYANSWTTLLPGVDKSLVNMILMLGPSLIYRLNSYEFVWKQEQEIGEEVRGVQVTSYSIVIGNTLKIMIYIELDLTLDEGLRNPLRLVFEDVKSSSSVNGNGTEKIILDIYSLKSADVKLDQFVEVTPGYGCNIYFQPGRIFPQVADPSQVHLVISESQRYNNDEQVYLVERTEIFAHSEMNYLRVNKGFYGISYDETLYDTDLGIGYTFDHDSERCRLVPLTKKTPGINDNGLFDLDQLFLVQGSIKYVGNTYLPNEWPFAVDYWESTLNNVKLDGDDYDKVVTTYYFATTTNKLGYIEHEAHTVPIAVIRKGSSKLPTSKLIYALHQRRDIHEFQTMISEDQYQGAFQINFCSNDWNQKKSLTLLIDSQDAVGLKFAEQNVHKLRESIRQLIVEEINISPLRIVELDILFIDDGLKAAISFIETPKLEDSLESYEIPVNTDVLQKEGYGYQITNAEDCLKFLATNTELRSIAFCGSISICIGLKDDSLIQKAMTGNLSHVCKLFMIPFGNLNHLRKQIALKDIDQAFESRIVGSTVELVDNEIKHEFKIQDMIDISINSKSTSERQAFIVVKEGAKLNVNQPAGQIKSINVANYGDCYRSCEKSDQLDCSVFSYCYNDTTNSYECLVSEGLNVTGGNEDGDKTIQQLGCTINKRNILFNYMKLPSKTFNDGAIGQPASIEDCAVKCSQSADCSSFQFCNSNSICYLPSKSYNDQQTNSSSDCAFYLLKASNHFQITGTKLVTNVIQTITGLDLDQCAATCYYWKSSESIASECRSFNFCAKEQSNLCAVSGATINDKGVQLTDSTNCINYEIVPTSRLSHEQLNSRKRGSRLSGGSIATIILFIAIGLAVGAGSPFAYKRIKKNYLDNGLPMQRLS